MTEHWTYRAACAPHNRPDGVSADLWTEPTKSSAGKAAGWGRGEDQQHAIRICRGCPVQAECLRTAMEMEGRDSRAGRHGVWAGTLPAERARLARENEMRAAG